MILLDRNGCRLSNNASSLPYGPCLLRQIRVIISMVPIPTWPRTQSNQYCQSWPLGSRCRKVPPPRSRLQPPNISKTTNSKREKNGVGGRSVSNRFCASSNDRYLKLGHLSQTDDAVGWTFLFFLQRDCRVDMCLLVSTLYHHVPSLEMKVFGALAESLSCRQGRKKCVVINFCHF